MNKYDIIFESLQEKVFDGELSVDEAEILNDLAYEKYILENTAKTDILGRTGLNSTIKKATSETKRAIKADKSYIKKCIKKNDFDSAYKAIDSCRKNFIELKNIVFEAPTTTSDDVFSKVEQFAKEFVSEIVTDIATNTLIKTAKNVRQGKDVRKSVEFGGLTVADAIKAPIGSTGMVVLKDKINKHRAGDMRTKNNIKNKCIASINKALKKLDTLEASVRKAENKYKEKK